MLSCIIVDDERDHSDYLEALLSNYDNLVILKIYNNSLQALKEISTTGLKADIIFMDIRMPSINGLELSKKIKRHYKHLIFVTAHKDYGFEAFELNATGYLLKPYHSQHLKKIISKITLQTS